MDLNQNIRIRAVLEIIGKPKEYVEASLKKYVDQMKENENLMIISEHMEEAQENKGVWSSFAELEVVVKGLRDLIAFCIDYMPASIEILKPEKFDFNDGVFTNFMNDILSKLHSVDMVAKQLGTENTFLKANMNKLIKNNLLVLIKFGANNIDKMVIATGIEKEGLKSFLKSLIEENKIKEESEGVYSLI
jgi:hypothetical protein